MRRSAVWRLLRPAWVTAGVLLLGVGAHAPERRGSAPAPARVAVSAVLSVGLPVSDMERSVAFYTGVLDFQKESDAEVVGTEYERLSGVFGVREHVVTLRLGDERLQLTEFIAPRGRPAPVDSRSNDRWFQHVAIVVSDMDRAYARLRSSKVQFASTGPQLLPASNRNAGGIRAFYFRDPDGHPLELLSFPPDKGAAKWHQPSDRLFRGIDHTAIVVSDTRASLRLYRDRLGMRIAGESENFGTEQEHLNNVEGARLRITSLRAAAGPGVEFLEYVAPRDGRPFPADERANDLVHWQTTVLTQNADSAAAILTNTGVPLVSRGVVTLPATTPQGIHKAVLVRDPDGHVLEMAEQ